MTLQAAADLTVTVRNLAGRCIAVLTPGLLESGTHTLLWNGMGTFGTRTPAGTYLLEVAANAADGGTTRALASLSLRR